MQYGGASIAQERDGNHMNKIIQKPKLKYKLSNAFFRALTVWFILVIFIFHAGASSVVTNPVTGITSNTAALNGSLTLTAPSANVWFQYGQSGFGYQYKTDNQAMSATGTFTATLSGSPLIAGNTYQVQAVFNDGNGTTAGNTQLFALPSVTPNTQYAGKFDKYSKTMINSRFNITQMATTAPMPYTDRMGSIFWGVMFGGVFLQMFLRQDDVTIPALVGMLIGGSIWGLMPPDYVSIAYSLTVVSFAGLVFSLIKNKI